MNLSHQILADKGFQEAKRKVALSDLCQEAKLSLVRFIRNYAPNYLCTELRTNGRKAGASAILSFVGLMDSSMIIIQLEYVPFEDIWQVRRKTSFQEPCLLDADRNQTFCVMPSSSVSFRI